MADSKLTEEGISRLIANNGMRLPAPDSYPDGFFSEPPIPASVFIPLFQRNEQWEMLFIRRTEHDNDRHSGQVAFPGGKKDPGDRSHIDTALREMEEEIGIGAQDVTVLGSLNEYRTVSNFLVHPVVGQIDWPVTFNPDSREVGRIFSIPLDWLADERNHEINQRVIDGCESALTIIHFQRYGGELLWGITAKLTVNLLQVLGLLPVR